MPVTQSQLARKLKLSRSTVAAALNPNSLICLREETRQRVLEEAARSSYRPHRYAQVMRAGKSRLIGFFHFGGLLQVAAERAWHAAQAIHAAGYGILANDVSWAPSGMRAGCDAMLDARVEGVIVAGLNDPDSVLELKSLRRAGIPLVTLSGNELPGTPHVRGDARNAIRRMTLHLASMGRTRLLLLTALTTRVQPGAYIWAGAERVKGFKEAIREASGRSVSRFAESPCAASAVQGRVVGYDLPLNPFDPYQPSRDLMQRILANGPPPDAVVCGSDDWAVGALAACRDAGIAVPGQIAITGYDNTAVGACLDTPLTTVAQPSRAMAEHAVTLLLKMIDGKAPGHAARSRLFPCKLVIRKSCGAKLPH